MAEDREPLVPITAVAPALGATVVWRTRGQLYVTVVVKATFALVPDEDMRLIEPEPLLREDVHLGGLPNRSAIAASELAPYLTRADITLTGHAYAPGGQPVSMLAVRLAVLRDRALVDKTLHVYGDRQGDAAPQPFERMSMAYERAYGGVGWAANPIGMGVESASPQPNLVSPTGPRETTVGFGPIASLWPNRRKRLGGTPRKALSGAIVELPDSFDFLYFQSAPEDQQTDFLLGDEWVLLEGLHPSLSGVRSRLPGARGVARIQGLTPSSPELARQIDLRADMLRIDGDRQTCSVVWRSPVPIRDEATLARVRVTAGVTIQGQDVALPADVPPRESTPPVVERSEDELETARILVDEDGAVVAQGQGRSGSVPMSSSAGPARPSSASSAKDVTRDPDEPLPELSGTLALSRTQERAAQRPALPFSESPQRGVELPRASSALPFPVPVAPVSAPGVTAGATRRMRVDELDSLKARPVLPFDAPPPGAAPPIPTARASAPEQPRKGEGGPPDFSSTVALSFDDDVRATGAAATPFERGGRAPEPLRDRPSVSSLPLTPPIQSIVSAPPIQPIVSAPPIQPIVSAPPSLPSSQVEAIKAPEPAIPVKAAAKRPATPEGIELWNDTGLSLGAVPASGAPGGKSIAVLVKATCDLVPKGQAVLRATAEPLSRDRFYEGERGRSSAYPTDFATHKARADVVLLGHAYAPGGSASVMDVSLRFGDAGNAFTRRLRVFGDRAWEKGRATMKPSNPASFDRIPIRYDHAFGGPKYQANPVGLGVQDPARPAGVAVPLPNLEDPDRLLRTPSQKVPPACFAPVLGAWRSRQESPGAEDDPWPAASEDSIATRFQAAPPEQQLDFLKGDEPFEMTGLHAKHALIQGSLPGLRARCFAAPPGDAAGVIRFEEVALKLDTVIFEVDLMVVHLVLRGAVPVLDERAPGIDALYLVIDGAGSGMSLDDARARFTKARGR
jgi:hypothetical protein